MNKKSGFIFFTRNKRSLILIISGILCLVTSYFLYTHFDLQNTKIFLHHMIFLFVVPSFIICGSVMLFFGVRRLKMKYKKRVLFIILLIIISTSLFMVTDHIVNYKTWGINGNGFRDNIYEDYDQTCDIHYFEEPDNCRVVDDDGVQVSEELVILINPKKGFACFSQDRDTMTINRIPCFDALP